jgi:aminoglycoside 3-N-acetyltransferase
MTIPTVTFEQIVALLAAVGLRRGDGVMVHAALQFLGQPEGGVGMYLNALSETINLQLSNPSSASGSLVVPTFNFAFAKGEPFDQDSTPSVEMGALAEHVRTQPAALRTPHALQSVAVLGNHRDDLASRDTPCAFDPGSAFDRMRELDFRLLLLGAGVQFTSLIHYCEQRIGVPYRFWKEFPGQVRLSYPRKYAGPRTYKMYARDLTLDPQVSSLPVQREPAGSSTSVTWLSAVLSISYRPPKTCCAPIRGRWCRPGPRRRTDVRTP